MVEALELFQGAARIKISRLDDAVSQLRSGRGSDLGTLIKHTLARFKAEIEELDAEASESLDQPDLILNLCQKYERLQPQLDVLHLVFATYQPAVGRGDVAVGIQHLIDVLMKDVLIEQHDPLVHLSPMNSYSTVDLVNLIDDLLIKIGRTSPLPKYDAPHPIAFNLPALNPNSALLSPILAHEVAHSAVEQVLMAEVEGKVGDRVDTLLTAMLGDAGLEQSGPEATQWADRFRDWCSELICDAVALVLTGPSFLLAFTAFAPPSSFSIVSTHPPLRDRIAFHLRFLDELGWTSELAQSIPKTLEWLGQASDNQHLLGTKEETFLRQAMSLIEDSITEVVAAHLSTGLSADETVPLVTTLAESFAMGVPEVEVGTEVATPWQVIYAGWMAAFRDRGDSPDTLLSAVGDTGFNQVLAKALEMSSIVSDWRLNERASV